MGLFERVVEKIGVGIDEKDRMNIIEKTIGMDTVTEISKFFSQQQASELMSGRLFITEEAINSNLKTNINHEDIEDFSLKFLDDTEIQIDVQHKKQGHISIRGCFDEFVHNSEQSSFTFRIVEKKLQDKGWIANLVADIGLRIMSCFWGSYTEKDFGGMKISFGGDQVKVDFREFLLASKWHQKKIIGTSIVDMIHIDKAESISGGLNLSTRLNLSEALKLAFNFYFQSAR